MGNSNLAKLRDLTKKLDFDSLSKETYTPRIKQYDMSRGTAMSFGLLNEPAISCAKTFASKGGVFPSHSHHEKEFLVVYVGMVVMTLAGKDHTLRQGDCLTIPAETEHYATFPESDCWFLAITIPQTAGWPDAPEGA